jgi:hypothetical protein
MIEPGTGEFGDHARSRSNTRESSMKKDHTAIAALLRRCRDRGLAEDKIAIEFAYPYSHLFDVTYEKILPKFYEASIRTSK